MSELTDAARVLTDGAARRDWLAAWDAAGRLLPLIADLRNTLPEDFRGLVWTGAINNRWFDIAELLAGAAASRADATLATRRLHAQMLMERGYYDEALVRLGRLLQRPELSQFDRKEAIGHVGRINKDRFIAARNAGDREAARVFLRDAIDAYLSWHTSHGSLWHAINAVALLSCPDALAFDPNATAKAREIAQQILNDEAGLAGDSYKPAILAEARIALDDFPAALELIRGYIVDPSIPGFQIGSFHRQVTQLWELDRGRPPWPEFVAMVGAAVLERGAVLRLSGDDVQRAKEVTKTRYEAVFGSDRFDSYENYRRGLERCSCVARIGRSVETGVGTGFVLPGKLLSKKLGDAVVLMTNAHVISESEDLRGRGALHPTEAVVTFAAMDGVPQDQEFGLGKLLFSSPPEELDVSVVELSETVLPKDPYRIAPVLPVRGSEARVRVIGHPSGRGLSLSVNKLLDHQAPKLHYLTATEGGSSGSPIFNQDWNLIGLHHAGGEQMPKLNNQAGTYEANEGIWIRAVCEAVDKALV